MFELFELFGVCVVCVVRVVRCVWCVKHVLSAGFALCVCLFSVVCVVMG